MGEQEVGRSKAERRREYIMSVIHDLEALDRMIDAGSFESDARRIGAEQELFLVDDDWRPATVGPRVLEDLDETAFTPEIGAFNLEINIEPLWFRGDVLRRLEERLRSRVAEASRAARDHGARLYLGGILPTLRKSDLTLDNITPRSRYQALNEALTRVRGGPYALHLQGVDEVWVRHDNVMMEASCTSFQFHLQVAPGEFTHVYNLAQLAIAPVLAAATNSPLLFGRRLWHETRIPVFQQSIDTRRASYHLRERSPRVGFGQEWLDGSVLELFREALTRFPVILDKEDSEDPVRVLEEGDVPALEALQFFNGTVYRWNRPCYGITDGKPHLRIEVRALPSGPTLRDEVANAAFFYGLVLELASSVQDVTRRMRFADVRRNFHSAAEYGLATQLAWIDGQDWPAPELILDVLLPAARKGLVDAGIDEDDANRYLDVIRDRVASRQTGSVWLLESILRLRRLATREEVLTALTAASIRNQREEVPVHEWPWAGLEGISSLRPGELTVEEFMTTDVVSVSPDEPIGLVGNLMVWRAVRNVPVEDSEGRLVGLLTSLEVIRHQASPRRSGEEAGDDADPEGDPDADPEGDPDAVAVHEVMQTDPLSVTPDTTIGEAVGMMHEEAVQCLPVVEQGRLVGILTEHDFVHLVGRLLRRRDRAEAEGSDGSETPD